LAVPPQTNEAFLREVDEELRRDQVLTLWRRYGRIAIGAVVAGLVALAGVLGWQHYRNQQAGAQSEQFSQVYDLLAAGKMAEAEKPLADLAKSDIATYRTLALYVQADVLLRDLDAQNPAKNSTKLKAAAAKFATVAQDQSVPKPFRDLALIRQTYAEYDTISPQVVIDRLTPLAVKGQPWFGSAGELVANAQLQLGHAAQAKTLLSQIAADEDVPGTIRQRVVQLAGTIDDDTAAIVEDKKKK
jgi:hypothetical protein